MKAIKFIILYIWQLPQNLLGLFLCFMFGTFGSLRTSDNVYIVPFFFNSGISLGYYIILQKNAYTPTTVKHERGHRKQSLMWGPLYLVTVGLVSFIRNIYDRIEHKDWDIEDRQKWYYSSYPEKQADEYGHVGKRWH